MGKPIITTRSITDFFTTMHNHPPHKATTTTTNFQTQALSPPYHTTTSTSYHTQALAPPYHTTTTSHPSKPFCSMECRTSQQEQAPKIVKLRPNLLDTRSSRCPSC